MNVLAILMSSVVLDRLGGEIDTLYEEKSENLYAIQLAWNSVETLERKREALLIYFGQSSDERRNLQDALKAQLAPWVNVDIPPITLDNLSSLMAAINQTQQEHRDQIDRLYLDNIAISDVMGELEYKIAWYKNIGLFLQVFGLALILARDLARKPSQ